MKITFHEEFDCQENAQNFLNYVAAYERGVNYVPPDYNAVEPAEDKAPAEDVAE